MRNLTVMSGLVTASAHATHPFQSTIRFVFTDFQPNINRDAVPEAEAANIIATAQYMPVKIWMQGDRPSNDHDGAIPIGPITLIERDGDRLIGEAVVWKQEFGDVVEYLEKATAAQEPVNFSWELWHSDVERDSAGVRWLKDCVVAGITVVGKPAYAGRTPLLSFASTQSRLEALHERVQALEARVMGESTMVEEDESRELAPELTDDAVTAPALGSAPVVSEGTAEETVTASADTSDIEVLQRELVELRAYRARIEASEARATLLAERLSIMSEAGLNTASFRTGDEALVTFLTQLDTAGFELYVRSLREMHAANASVEEAPTQERREDHVVPDLSVALGGSQGIPTTEVVAAFRSYAANAKRKRA
jgi:hypothetical protein